MTRFDIRITFALDLIGDDAPVQLKRVGKLAEIIATLLTDFFTIHIVSGLPPVIVTESDYDPEE